MVRIKIVNKVREVVSFSGSRRDTVSALNKIREGLLNGKIKLN